MWTVYLHNALCCCVEMRYTTHLFGRIQKLQASAAMYRIRYVIVDVCNTSTEYAFGLTGVNEGRRLNVANLLFDKMFQGFFTCRITGCKLKNFTMKKLYKAA